jgi:hypothetical protein
MVARVADEFAGTVIVGLTFEAALGLAGHSAFFVAT